MLFRLRRRLSQEQVNGRGVFLRKLRTISGEKMREKPKVLVSKCLGFCKCRYDGQVINSEFVQALEPYVDFIQVCPEVDIGLGIPRASVKLVSINGN